MSKAQTLKVPVELVAKSEGEAEDDGLQDAPLFSALEGDKRIAHVLVIRQDPDEGTLGKMPPTVTELDIKRRWGGGTFQLQGRDERNRPMKGAFRTVAIAGDPIFESEAAQAKWNRQHSVDSKPTPASDAIGVREIFALLSTTESKQKAEADRRAAELEAAHKRELEWIKVEGELRARERAAEDDRRERMAQEREERRRKEDEEREERRRRDDAERDERRRKDEETARQRDKEFQLQLAQLNRKGNADGSEMLLKGVELMRQLSPGGGESPDPVTAVATALLPGVLEKFGGAAGKPAPPAASKPAPALSANAVTLDGPIGSKAQQVIAHLEQQGYNPEDAISQMFDMLLKARRKTAPEPADPPPPAASSPAAAAPPPAPNATTRVKARTTEK